MDERDVARQVRSVQNLNAKLAAGFFIGLVVGIIVGAYVILPALGMTWAGLLGAFVAIIGGGVIGQRIVLNMLTR